MPLRLLATILLCCLWVKPAQALSPAPLPEGASVTVNGEKLWYWTEGSGEPLLLVEGGPGASGYLDPFFHELTDTFTVIHFRGLGRGKSARPAKATDYSFERDIADLEGFRQALGLGQVNLLGHSYGGMLVTGYALQHPQGVKRLIIANGLYSGEMWQAGTEHVNVSIRDLCPEIWEQLMALRARGIRSSAPEHLKLISQVPEALLYIANVTNTGKTPVEINPDVYFGIGGDDVDFQVGGSIAALDFRARLRELAMPVLITASRFDRVVLPRYTLQYPRLAPQAEFVMFEQSGHALYLEEHEKFSRTVRAFLTKPLPAGR